jgi:4-hydroxy-tetrahydrodipicolinate synthase
MPDGVHTALVTPFSYGGIDLAAFRRLLEIQKESRVSGVVVLGTTGESPTVNGKERDVLTEEAVKSLGGKKTVTVGCGCNDTGKTVELVRRAASAGADLALVVTPYYNRPSQKGLLRHFLTVAEGSPLPVVIYNVPSRTGVDISAETLSVLSEHPNIAACKEAGSDIQAITEKAAVSRTDIFCGNDTMLLSELSLGAKGAVSVCSNIEPDRTCEIYEKYVSGDANGAREAFFALYPFLSALGCDTNPVPIKAVMSACGLISDAVRPPLCRLSEQKRAALLYAAADAGIYIK